MSLIAFIYRNMGRGLLKSIDNLQVATPPESPFLATVNCLMSSGRVVSHALHCMSPSVYHPMRSHADLSQEPFSPQENGSVPAQSWNGLLQAITAAPILRPQWLHCAQRTKFLITSEEFKWKHPRKRELSMFFETAPFRTGSEQRWRQES